ncbi:MAG: BlaI/MecI/CopY family transcriptional regulator [Sedimentisphaerales bacterium]|nr:BlaI/MecI/CopY family transcriptional regulator [Sedimentisphaerales bacterium]
MTRKRRADKPSVELTEAEWAIMRAVWEHQPCAAGTVQEALAASKGWAYSTVKTTMDRMVDKELLEVRKIRNLRLYSTTVGEVEAKRGEFYRMLKRAFDGALAPMLQFLVEHEGLSATDARELREIARRAAGAAKSDRADDSHGQESKDGPAQ